MVNKGRTAVRPASAESPSWTIICRLRKEKASDHHQRIADLVKVLQEKPEWLHTLRGVIISDELGAVPASLRQLAARLEGMGEPLTTVSSQVSGIMGGDYESHAARVAPRRMRLPGDVSGIILRYQDRRHNALWLEELATAAMLQGTITREEADDLPRVDLVFAVSRRNGDDTLVAAESSMTVQVHDVDRAERRAQILARAQDLTVTPMTIGAAIEAEAQDLASQRGTTHVHLETSHSREDSS